MKISKQKKMKTSKTAKSAVGRGNNRKSGQRPDAPRCTELHYQAGIISAGVTAQFGSFEFQLDQFSGYADYSATFDAYRLRKVRLDFIPHCNTHNLAVVAPTTTNSIRPICTVLDFDDSNVPSSIVELEQYQTFKEHDPLSTFSIVLKPRPQLALYAGGVTLGYSPSSPNTWIDAANDDVVHYGVKWGTRPNGASQTTFQTWSVQVTGWFEFRQPR